MRRTLSTLAALSLMAALSACSNDPLSEGESNSMNGGSNSGSNASTNSGNAATNTQTNAQTNAAAGLDPAGDQDGDAERDALERQPEEHRVDVDARLAGALDERHEEEHVAAARDGCQRIAPRRIARKIAGRVARRTRS